MYKPGSMPITLMIDLYPSSYQPDQLNYYTLERFNDVIGEYTESLNVFYFNVRCFNANGDRHANIHVWCMHSLRKGPDVIILRPSVWNNTRAWITHFLQPTK